MDIFVVDVEPPEKNNVDVPAFEWDEYEGDYEEDRY